MQDQNYKNIEKMDDEQRYDAFIRTVLDTEVFFMLTDKTDDLVFMHPRADLSYVPVWPYKEFAQSFVDIEKDKNYRIIEGSLEGLMASMIMSLDKDGYKIGVFPLVKDGESHVFVVEPADLANDLIVVANELYGSDDANDLKDLLRL